MCILIGFLALPSLVRDKQDKRYRDDGLFFSFYFYFDLNYKGEGRIEFNLISSNQLPSSLSLSLSSCHWEEGRRECIGMELKKGGQNHPKQRQKEDINN